MQGSVNLSDKVMQMVVLNSVIFSSPVCLTKKHCPFDILSRKLLLSLVGLLGKWSLLN